MRIEKLPYALDFDRSFVRCLCLSEYIYISTVYVFGVPCTVRVPKHVEQFQFETKKKNESIETNMRLKLMIKPFIFCVVCPREHFFFLLLFAVCCFLRLHCTKFDGVRNIASGGQCFSSVLWSRLRRNCHLKIITCNWWWRGLATMQKKSPAIAMECWRISSLLCCLLLFLLLVNGFIICRGFLLVNSAATYISNRKKTISYRYAKMAQIVKCDMRRQTESCSMRPKLTHALRDHPPVDRVRNQRTVPHTQPQ